jgi:dCMP deaminase
MMDGTCWKCGALLKQPEKPGPFDCRSCGAPYIMVDTRKPKTTKWDLYFMSMAEHAATLSKDESTKLGCVIVGPDNEVRSTGYNSFPRGIDDNRPERQQRPWKYKFFEHAERNAIYNAARMGTPLKGCVLYCAWPPCSDCARAVIQAGIVRVVVRGEAVPGRWDEDMAAAKEMLDEAGVELHKLEVE